MLGPGPGSAHPKSRPKCAPPQLKSFLEKTLTRTNPPHFPPQPDPPPPRPQPPTLRGLRLIWRLYETEAQGILTDPTALELDDFRA